MPDFKIEVLIKDVARGDLDLILDFLLDQGPDFDADKGNFIIGLSVRDHAEGSWFPADAEDD